MMSKASLRLFERKCLRMIYGPVQDGEMWKIRTNQELEKITDDEDIVRFLNRKV